MTTQAYTNVKLRKRWPQTWRRYSEMKRIRWATSLSTTESASTCTSACGRRRLPR